MPLGINNLTEITMENLTSIGNNTSPADLFININHTVYGGYFFYIMLWVTWIVLFFSAQGTKDQLLNNLFSTGVVISIVALLMRGLELTGTILGLINDFQMWSFIIPTIILGTIIYATKDN